MRSYRTTPDDRVPADAEASTTMQGGPLVYVAVVHTSGTICHICAATTMGRLLVHVGEYVRENAMYQLWPIDADRVLDLLKADRTQDAVDLYFAAGGLRWDREELLVHRTGLGVEA